METLPAPFSVSDTAPELARRFAMILAGLGALVARRFLRMPHLMRFTLLLYSRLARAVRRFERALTRPAGKMRAPRVRAERRDIGRVRPVGLPSGRGWLVRELGWEAAGYMSQLAALLAEVEMRAVIAAVPATGRILRPICRMLGGAAPVVVVVARPAPMMVVVARPALMVVVEAGLTPTGLPGVAGDCEVFATSW